LSRLPGKRARPILRGRRRGDAPPLPDEIFFAVIQKKVVTPNDFSSLGQLSRTLLGFVDRYNQTARPFSWKFTASDLHDLMDRISRHDQQHDPQDQPLPKAA